MESKNQDYKQFLQEACELDSDTIERLIDAGFDDLESLQLAELNTIEILGFEQAIYKQIQRGLATIGLSKGDIS